MATHRIPILANAVPTGACSWASIKSQLTLTNSKDQLCVKMPDPAGNGDHGVQGSFSVPENYVGTPVLRIVGILDGIAGTNLAFGCQVLALADDGAFDQAYAAEDTASADVSTEADEDLYVETISLSTPTFAAGDEAFFSFFVDDSAASPYTGNFLLTGLYFEYADA